MNAVIVAAGLQRVPGEVRLQPGGDRDDHRLADGARDAQNVGGRDARQRARHDHARGGLEARRAHRIAALAHVVGHGAHRILADRGHVRNDHDADHETRAQHVEAGQARDDLLQERRDEQQREVAVDHRRHGAEQFEHRLDDLAHLMRRELAQVDGDDRAAGYRQAQRDERRHQRAGHQRQDAEVRLVEQRRPQRVGEEVARATRG